MSTRWRWTGTRLRETTEPGVVRIIDSWLVDGGRVRGLALHAARFRFACARFGMPDGEIIPFLRAVVDLLPGTGRWFPRVELTGERRLQLWLRPAPAPGNMVRLWYPGEPDRRRHPNLKGPDLDRLTELRNSAMAEGADDAVLLSRSGHVLETATSSILWWRNGTLCAPPPGPGLLPSVTRTLLGPVWTKPVTPAELSGIPVWTVNALHGIRPVTGWLGLPVDPAPVTDDVNRWQARLDALAVPVHPNDIKVSTCSSKKSQAMSVIY